MIPIFRRIRKQYNNNNKPIKYMRYAVGEIVLVMVGILLALQVNNWNENRKSKIIEIKLLKELRSDLNQNLNDINVNIEYMTDSKKSTEIILQYIENKTPYIDSLDYHFSNLYPYVIFNMNETTYESFKQIGFNLISNDSLRVSISDLYANQFKSYRGFETTYLVAHYNNFISPMFMLDFEFYRWKDAARPKNYIEFIKESKSINILTTNVDILTNFSNMQSRLNESIVILMAQIDKEIDN